MTESVVLLSRTLPLFVERENKVIDTTFKLVTHLDDSLFIEIIKANTLWRAIPYARVTHLLLSEDTESVQPYYKARENTPLFFFTLSTDSDALHYIISNSHDDINFLIELLQLLHTLPYPGLPEPCLKQLLEIFHQAFQISTIHSVCPTFPCRQHRDIVN